MLSLPARNVGFASFYNIFGITTFAWEMVDHAHLCNLGDGVLGFHQGSSMGGRRLVCFVASVSEMPLM